jgi:eukaryotic-like serine/threonine-protein kinase
MTDPTGEDAQDTVPTPAPAGDAPSTVSRPPVRYTPSLADGVVLAGRFRVVRFIARGGMGEVYEAEDLVLKDRVAVKTIRADVAGDGRTMERFLREVHLARRVTHPNVARTYDIFPDGPATFLTMELLSGETLAQRLARVGRIRPEEALPLVEQMAAAVSAAHEAGVVHRDFKSAGLWPALPTAGGLPLVVGS